MSSPEQLKDLKAENEVSHQLSSTIVAQQFGEVNVQKQDNLWKIAFTILMEPTGTAAEGWQTGVALDASLSMKKAWIKQEVEAPARQMIAYLAANLDADGRTTVIYWACGDGSRIEEIGDLTAEDCEHKEFRGPTKVSFGTGTVLQPAVSYFAERFRDAKNGMYIFMTDGRLSDLAKVKAYTVGLCREIEAGKRNPLKCVLIGVGDEIDERQMEELDDLESNTSVDIWDHKLAKDMRSLVEIFAEVVDEHQVIAPKACIYDETGVIVKNFSDGLPSKVTFTMPASSKWFELEVGGKRIRQLVI